MVAATAGINAALKGCARSVPSKAPVTAQISDSAAIAATIAGLAAPKSRSTRKACCLACSEKFTALKTMKVPTTNDSNPNAVRLVCKLWVS